jgi:multidrug efflux pump subunit AcrA (membrane-fusion protein)
LREWFIEKYDADTADRIVSQWNIDDLKRPEPEIEELAATSGFAEEDDMGKVEELQAALAAKDAEFAEKAAALASTQAELERERSEKDRATAEKRKAESLAFCEGLVKEGRLVPAQQPAILDFMEIVHSAGEYEFAEGGKQSADVKLREFLKTMPVQIEFAERATKERAGGNTGAQPAMEFSGPVDEARLAVHRQAKAACEKEGVSYETALDKIMKGA